MLKVMVHFHFFEKQSFLFVNDLKKTKIENERSHNFVLVPRFGKEGRWF